MGSGGIARGAGPASSSQPNVLSLQGSNGSGAGGSALSDGNFVSVSNASASLVPASPVTPMMSGSSVPRALVALVTMQNVNEASQLEKSSWVMKASTCKRGGKLKLCVLNLSKAST